MRVEGKRIAVRLNFQSPLLIGKKRSTPNFIESDEVIKGSIIRAAFAKIILKNCTQKSNNKKQENWIEIRNKEACQKCKYYKICENFDQVTFSYFYPKNSEVVPLTAMTCKNHQDEHGYNDSLIYDKTKGCPICIKELDEVKEEKKKSSGRLEYGKGLRTVVKDNLTTKRPYKVGKNISVKNAINPYTRTSAEGKLYSVETVVKTMSDEEIKNPNKEPDIHECEYEGYIYNMSEEELKLFKNLRVGGDTTVGLGKCRLEVINEASNKNNDITTNDLQEFSEGYYSTNVAKDGNKDKDNKNRNEDKKQVTPNLNYIAVKLKSDMQIPIRDKDDNYIDIFNEYYSLDELKEIWKKVLDIDKEDINVEKVYTNIINYRGYDTSLKTNNKREKVSIFAEKGTVIVFSSSKQSCDKLAEYFNGHKAFGAETENGFGAFEIYVGR